MSKEYSGVWVFSELPSLAKELLGKGRELADQLGTELVAISHETETEPQKYTQHGADKVLLLSNPSLSTFQVDTYTDAFAELAGERKPEIILIGATRTGLEFAPRLAERLKTGCVTEATKLELDADKNFVLMDRVTFGGNVVETHVFRVKPQIATIPKGLFSPPPPDTSKKGEIIKVEPRVRPQATKLVETKPKDTRGVKLADAPVIISFGRGLKKKEDIAIVEQLAAAVGGVVACSRPIAEDLKWLPENQYVGLSGQKVSPKVYFACGISGQIQHLTGIRGSRIVVAINNDPKAPIFEFSDYGIVADMYQALPAITQAAKELSKK